MRAGGEGERELGRERGTYATVSCSYESPLASRTSATERVKVEKGVPTRR